MCFQDEAFITPVIGKVCFQLHRTNLQSAYCSVAIIQTETLFLDPYGFLSSAVDTLDLHPNWIYNGISVGASTMKIPPL